MSQLSKLVATVGAHSFPDRDSIKVEADLCGRKTRLRSDLANAINAKQFRVYYQPEINLKTNELFALEAFIRWEHPVFGTLLPNEFISIAEESNFILEMGDWVLHEVCRNYSEWIREGLPPVKIAVNYSSMQFIQEDFIENIKRITESFGLMPDFLIIEILERVSIRNYSLLKLNIHKLHELGIQVALDDFGTGFSSLEYLSKLHVDILKIDQLFIDTIPHDKTNIIIVEALLNLAQKLGVYAVAEGIETQEQLDFLKALNCPAGQGFFFSKPIPFHLCKTVLSGKTLKNDICNQAIGTSQEKRKYNRHRFPMYLEASMTLLRYGRHSVNLGSTLVLIQDISAGGLCFFSTVNIPINNNLLIQFTTTFLGKQVVLYGTPVWVKEDKRPLRKYGVQFKISNEYRKHLHALIRQLDLETKEGPENISGDFVRQSPYSYFQV